MRLIDADALKDALRFYQYPYGVEFLVRTQPTIDAVPVVRCKDCKFWEDCYRIELSRATDYCSYVERREDG